MFASAFTLLASAEARVQCQYEVAVILGPPDPVYGPPATIATSINNLGHVVGYYEFLGGSPRAFLWTPETGLQTLPLAPGTLSRAYDINDAGEIVGRFDLPADGLGYVGFLYDGQQYLSLGAPPGGSYSHALSINNQSQVVGYWGNSVTGKPASQAFLWQNGLMTSLATDLGGPNAAAHAINDLGQVVGWFGEADWIDAHGFLLQDGNVTDLGVIPGGYTAQANAINDLGYIAGHGIVPNVNCSGLRWHAFLREEQLMIDLGTLPQHGRSRAKGMNDAGQVVGVFDHDPTCSTPGAFMWQNGVMTDLDDLVIPEVPLAMYCASAINDAGQIAGHALLADGAVAGVRLTPIEQRLGDLNHDCEVGISDLLDLLAAWGPNASSADLDGNGSVGITDLLILLGNWG